jgi:thiol-disulfide isomerase/thioredoxin
MDILIATLKMLGIAALLGLILLALAKFVHKEELNKKSITALFLRSFLAAIFLFSAYAKLYGMSVYGAITTFEQKQLLQIGFSPEIAPYFSRFIIGAEIALGLGFLQVHYLRKLILPLSALLLVVFNVHLAYSMMAGIGGNCGCFGDLLPMTPTEAFIKNILILGLIGWLWFGIREEQIRVRHNFFVALSIALASILFMFVIAPIQHAAASDIPIVIVEPGNDDIVTLDDPTEVPNTNGETPNNGTNTSNENPEPVKPAYEPKKAVSGFAKYAPGIDDGKKLLLFFAPGCEHCQEAAKQMVEMSKKDKDFPKMFIIFMNEEPEKIPEFFEKAGKKITHTVLDVGTFWTVIGMKRDTPGVLYLWNGNEVIFMDGINENAFTPEKLKKALDKETL